MMQRSQQPALGGMVRRRYKIDGRHIGSEVRLTCILNEDLQPNRIISKKMHTMTFPVDGFSKNTGIIDALFPPSSIYHHYHPPLSTFLWIQVY